MKKIIYLMVMGIAMLQTAKAQNFNPNLSAILQFKLDSLVNEFAPSGNTKGVSIGVYCPGQGYWTGVSGVSHPGVNLTADMKQGLASNSKLFIGVTMLKLDEQQLINLDNPISTWLAPIANVNPAITVRQLLNHTSGISDPFFTTSLLDSINLHPTHVYSTAEVLSYLGAPSFAVGTSYGYSNINYLLAGMIAESATGLTMAQLVRQNILTPLNLNNTFYDYAEAELTPLAHRWHNHIDYNDTSRVSLNSAGGPAGSIFSTADDMAHWYHALMDGQVLNQNSFEELTDFVSFGAIGNYGLGIQRTGFYQRENWGHGGSTHGYKTRSIYDPCNKLVVCGLSNDDWSAIDGITLLMYKALLDFLPDCSAAITGEATVCQGQQTLTYTVPPIANATSYTWTLANGFTGLSATNSITIDISQVAGSGDISVKGVNMYGEGSPASFTVTVNPLPTTPTASLVENMIHSDAPNGNQWYNQDGILIGETNQDYEYLLAGNYYTIVTLLGCSSTQSNIVATFNAGISETFVENSFTVFPNPTTSELNLEFIGTNKNSSYTLSNMLHQEVMKGDFSKKTKLEIGNLDSGIYLLTMENEDQIITTKIIKR